MKRSACVLILAFVVAPASGTALGRDRARGTAEQPAVEQSSPKPQPPAQGKAKGKAKKPGTPGTSGSGTPQGAACSPDTTPPTIHSVSATPNVLWSPNHRLTPIAIRANVTDNCSAVTWTVTSIASDEPVNGTGEGDTEPDWAVTAPHAVNLRAERAGSGDGRVYTISITARDTAGNSAAATTTVSVPHSQKR